MKKNKKFLILGILLIVLVGCTNVIDPETKQVFADKVISLGSPWDFGKEGWFSALFVWPIAQVLNFFAQYTGAVLAIVIVTVLIKLLTLRFTIKSTVQQQKIQALQPEMARLEQKYKGRTDEQAKMQKATDMQKLYQKHGVNPLAGMGGTLLQLPIMLAMYQAVIRAELIVEGSIFGNSLKITPLEGFTSFNITIIVIYLLMIVAQAASIFLPQYLAKRKTKRYPNDKKPEGPNPQTMMFGSLIMIVYLALNWAVGMSLYWMISSLTQVLTTLYIQWRHVDSK